MSKEAKKKPGRKPGTPNREYDQVVTYPGRCKRCGSTNRSPYFGDKIEHAVTGIDPAGNPYDTVVWRRTKCLDCGQVRKEMSYELRKKN